MSNKMTGLVKWFNADKGFGFITLTTAAKMYSYISLQFRATTSKRLMKVRKFPLPLRMAQKVQQLETFLHCNPR